MQIEQNKTSYAVLLQQKPKLPPKNNGLPPVSPPPSQGEKMRDAIEQRESELEFHLQQLEQAGEQSKAANDQLKAQLTCLLISGRIIAGDEVPPADHKYLMKNDPSLYAKSILMRVQKNNPHKYKKASPDEQPEGKRFSFDPAQLPDKARQHCSSTQELLARMLDTTA